VDASNRTLIEREYLACGAREAAKKALELLEKCRSCPHDCGVRRLDGEKGVCLAPAFPQVSSFCLHHGEEPPISRPDGSGAIFFTWCNLRCLFCQNHDISQDGEGYVITPAGLVRMIMDLQKQGAQNINLVSPSHFTAPIIACLAAARSHGLKIPVVYNTSGYDSLESLRLMEPHVDVYMPDLKYSDNDAAKTLSGAEDYWEVATAAIKEMWRQSGPLVTDSRGRAVKGVLIRHLVLPGGLAGTEEVMRFISEEISPEVHISLMSQYHPANRAFGHPVLSSMVTQAVFDEAVASMRRHGLKNGWVQNRPL
jgi:putative pyruvate formate lyase activating enzyme